jgi:hypothetical protein
MLTHELNCNLLLDYKFILLKNDINNSRFLKVYGVGKYEVWLWSSRNYFTANVRVYLQLSIVSFKELPLSSYAFSPTMLQMLETFLELFLWNSFQCRHFFFFFKCLLCPEIFIPLRHTLFLETARSHSQPKGWYFSNQFLYQKLLERDSAL